MKDLSGEKLNKYNLILVISELGLIVSDKGSPVWPNLHSTKPFIILCTSALVFVLDFCTLSDIIHSLFEFPFCEDTLCCYCQVSPYFFIFIFQLVVDLILWEVVNKNWIFYGQADRKGGGVQAPQPWQ